MQFVGIFTGLADGPVRTGPKVQKLEPVSEVGPRLTKIGTAVPKDKKY